MNKGLVMLHMTVLIVLLAMLLVIATSSLLFGDGYLEGAIGEIVELIKSSIK